jgi:hypothetical protein
MCVLFVCGLCRVCFKRGRRERQIVDTSNEDAENTIRCGEFAFQAQTYNKPISRMWDDGICC